MGSKYQLSMLYLRDLEHLYNQFHYRNILRHMVQLQYQLCSSLFHYKLRMLVVLILGKFQLGKVAVSWYLLHKLIL
jgi:hypothetical protein